MPVDEWCRRGTLGWLKEMTILLWVEAKYDDGDVFELYRSVFWVDARHEQFRPAACRGPHEEAPRR